MDNVNFAPLKISRKTTDEFIENRLPAYHSAFDRPPLRCDAPSGSHVANSQAQVVPAVPTVHTISAVPIPTGLDVQSRLLAPRETITDFQAMKLWGNILPEALSQLCTRKEPKLLSEKRCGIRDKKNWEAIYNALEAARNEYQDVEGTLGRARKIRRKVADNLAIPSTLTKAAKVLVPDNTYAAPILGAVDLILDAAQRSAEVRTEVLESFENLIDVFASVELFLNVFPGDGNIRKASIDLTATILEAIERAIAFFHGSSFKRGVKAVGTGGRYETGLRDNLSSIKIKSKALMDEASKSNTFKIEMHSQQTQSFHKQTSEKLAEMDSGINALKDLFNVYLERKERELEAARQRAEYFEELAWRNQSSRPASPWPATAQVRTPSPYYTVDRHTLRDMLGFMDVDSRDIIRINDRKEEISHQKRAHAEQIVSSTLFQQWIVSTESAKLLVQWDTNTPESIAGISPLTVFCTTMAQALQVRNQFISVLWFCGQHCDRSDAGDCIGGRAMAASLVDQILRQYLFYMVTLNHEINSNLLQGSQSLNELLKLLNWLIRQIPREFTVFLVIDGVYLFEREEFWSDAQKVFICILRLVNDTSVPATVKVLFTSAPGTTNVRAAFEEEGLILSIDGLPYQGDAPSDERMIREMGVN